MAISKTAQSRIRASRNMPTRLKLLAAAVGIAVFATVPTVASDGPLETFTAFCLDTLADPAKVALAVKANPLWKEGAPTDPLTATLNETFLDTHTWLLAGNFEFGSLFTGQLPRDDRAAAPTCVLTVPRGGFTLSDFERPLKSAASEAAPLETYYDDGGNQWYVVPRLDKLRPSVTVRFDGAYVQLLVMYF